MRLSISKLNVFKECERHFFYQHVRKDHPTDQVPQKYGKFGNCVHQAIENINDYPNHREAVNHYWIDYELFKTDMLINNAYDAVEYALDLNYKFKHKEKRIEFEFKGYKFTAIIDGVLDDNSLLDWKTSTYDVKKIEAYKTQLLFYSWVYWKIEHIMPLSTHLIFCKRQKSGEFIKPIIFEVNEKILNDIEQMVISNIKSIESKKVLKDYTFNKTKCFFCGYKKKCHLDTIGKKKILNLTIGMNYLQIVPQDPIIDKVLNSNFSYEVDNKFFFQKAVQKKYNYHHDGIIKLYKKGRLPIGFLKKTKAIIQDYKDYLKSKHIDLIINPQYTTRPPLVHANLNCDKLNFPHKLWDFQEDIINKTIQEKIFFGDIATGAGKTVMSAEIIRRLNLKTLFVVDVSVLLDQAKEEFEEMLSIKCGVITQGKQDWRAVNVATIQTCIRMIKKEDIEFLHNLKQCNIIIIDEAHGAKSKSYQTLMETATPIYRIGLSGTAYADGNSSLELYKTLGFPLIKLSTKNLIDIGFLIKPRIIFLKYQEPEYYAGNYEDVFSQIAVHPNKLDVFIKLIKENKDRFNLVICRRLDHIKIIENKLLENDLHPYIIKGSITKTKRNKIRNDMKDGKINILIGTDSIVQKGLNIPNIDRIYNFTCNLGSIFSKQSLGRGLRKTEGKTDCIYYDWYDSVPELFDHTKKRIKVFENEGFKIEEFIYK